MMKGLGFIDFAYEKDAVNEKIEKLFHQLLGAAKDPLYGDEYCSVLIYEYIMSIRQTMMEHKKYSGLGDKDILQHAVIYMNENYASDITLEELAEIGEAWAMIIQHILAWCLKSMKGLHRRTAEKGMVQA